MNRTLLLFSAVLLLLTGCSTANIGRFAQATEDCSGYAAKAFSELNESTIEKNIAVTAADPSKAPSPDDKTFDNVLKGRDLAVRTELLESLHDYAASLKELSEADYLADVESASEDLNLALSKMNDAGDKAGIGRLSSQNLEIISTAVYAFGVSLVEYKRYRAIKTIVVEADPAIQKVCGLLSREIPTFADFVRSNYETIETELMIAYGKEAPHLNYSERVERLEQIRRMRDAKLQVKPFFDSVAEAAVRIAEAHAAQKEDMELDSKDTREKLKTAVDKLVELGKSVQQFYKNMKKTN